MIKVAPTKSQRSRRRGNSLLAPKATLKFRTSRSSRLAPRRAKILKLAPDARSFAKPSDGHEKQPTTLRRGRAEQVLEALAAQIRICTRCPLCHSRTIAVPGEGKPTAPVMIIGEGPGSKEDQTGRPFVGNAGRYLDHVVEGSGFDRSDFF